EDEPLQLGDAIVARLWLYCGALARGWRGRREVATTQATPPRGHVVHPLRRVEVAGTQHHDICWKLAAQALVLKRGVSRLDRHHDRLPSALAEGLAVLQRAARS